MIDQNSMRLMLENMERAAEAALRSDSSFHQALRSLKDEIDRDPQVQTAANNLRTCGNRVFSSFVPHIRVRIRTSEGVVSLPLREEVSIVPSAEQVAHLIQELRSATAAVIMRSHYREELDRIMNEAIGTSRRFEGIASEIENAGHEIVICLDLSAYTQVRESIRSMRKTRIATPATQPLSQLLSAQDLKFLSALKIALTEN
jgi:hypothetical protein